MSIEGDLKDIGLGTIVQAICIERRKGRLLLNCREQEGVIFFDNGEIVHASLGDLEGVEAIYKLLTWNSGWFRLTEQMEVPRHTIRMNWNHLLLDGLRRVDEKHRGEAELTREPVDLSPGEIEEDRLLENNLIYLMSKLEQFMYHLNKLKLHKRAQAALNVLGDMVNEVVKFGEACSGGCSLMKAIVQAVEKFPQARILHIANNRLSVKTAQNLYKSWADDPADRNFFFKQVCRGAIHSLNLIFAKMAGEFHSKQTHKQWVETYEVFLVELKRTMERIPF